MNPVASPLIDFTVNKIGARLVFPTTELMKFCDWKKKPKENGWHNA
jgi:hypothetical protein